MAQYIIADLHLQTGQPQVALFERFLSHLGAADSLYILGDLFEYWIGDDDPNPLHAQIAQRLAQAAKRYPIYFLNGNRDVLLGQQWLQSAQLWALPNPCVLVHQGQRLLLCHGDELCTDDAAYQRYRLFVSNATHQRWFFRLPLRLRLRIGRNIRNNSSQQNQQKAAYLMDVNHQAVQQYCQRYNCQVLIHGHTHQSALHQQHNIQRYVVGDWHEDAQILRVDQKGIRLLSVNTLLA